MSHFNKNLSPLLLLALFINVTTFSMNAKAAIIDIYNYVSKPNLGVTIQCGTGEGDFFPYVLPYGQKYEFTLTSLSAACSFRWDGGVLSYHMVYDPKHDTCSTCVWFLKPKPGGFCFQKPDGEVCSQYDG